jgi:hypothetical protein
MIHLRDLTVKNFMIVDQLVTDQITNIELKFNDNKSLLKIYQKL